MKKRNQSIPSVISYDSLSKLFSSKLTTLKKFKYAGNSPFGSKVEASRSELIDYIDQNKVILNELENKTLKFIKYSIAHRPDVYVARTKNKENNQYFTAKTFMPQKAGKKKEVKIYLGKAKDYDYDTKSHKAKRDAENKMRKTLIRRLGEGSI